MNEEPKNKSKGSNDVAAIMKLESEIVDMSYQIKEFERYDLAHAALNAASALLDELHKMKQKALGNQTVSHEEQEPKD